MRYKRLSYQYLVMSSSGLRPLTHAALDLGPGLAQLVWRPAADVYETAGAVVVTVELPGVDEDDIDLMLYEDALVLQGLRRLPRPQEDSHYHSAEIRQGSYRLEVPLRAEIDRENVDARYERGLLTVTLPKVAPR